MSKRQPKKPVRVTVFHAAMPLCDKKPGSPVVYEPCTILAHDLDHAHQMCKDTGFVLLSSNTESKD